VESPPPHPLAAAVAMASNNTGTTNAGFAAQARASVCLHRRSHSKISSIGKTQTIGKRFQGVLSREEGDVTVIDGATNAIATIAFAPHGVSAVAVNPVTNAICAIIADVQNQVAVITEAQGPPDPPHWPHLACTPF
jgi:hypothetical protein